jgi:hypothetical protein
VEKQISTNTKTHVDQIAETLYNVLNPIDFNKMIQEFKSNIITTVTETMQI